jgi:Family of unknown function (DUF5675)
MTPRKVRLIRGQSTEQGTFGVLVYGSNSCFTLELPWLNNVRKLSCIPLGTYDVVPHKSPKFGRCLLVENVPARDNILFHSANLAGNSLAGWDTQLQGCIAPFRRHGYMRNRYDKMQRAGLVSRPATQALYEWAGKAGFTLVIMEAS